MQSTFGVIMLALVDGVPRVLNLRQMLQYFVDAPARGDGAPHAVRAGQGAGARAHPGGAEDRRRQHRRGDPDHPRLGDHGRGGGAAARALRALGAADGRDPQHAAGEADRAGDRAARGGAGRGARAPSPTWRTSWATAARRFQIIKDELQEVADKYGDERRTEILGETGELLARGPDRRRGDGDHRLAPRATSSACRWTPTGSRRAAGAGSTGWRPRRRTGWSTSSWRARTTT